MARAPEAMFDLKTPVEPAPLTLHCTRGDDAPSGLTDDARELLALPAEVKARFADVVGPYLHGEPDQAQQSTLQRLCEESDIPPERLIGPIRAGRFLVTSAAKASLTTESFSEDIARLHDDPHAIRELIQLLMPVYEKEAPALRAAIVERTVAEHGRLVESAHWRIDNIVNSEHGDGINVPVAVLTFDYREGEKRDRVTLHLLPEQLNQLRSACLQMIPERDA